MANKDCGIARDLMPLVIDGASSEESKEFVDDHVAGCPECQRVYGEMRSAPSPTAAPEASDAAFADSMRHIARRRTRKRWLVSLAVLTLSLALTVSGLSLYERTLWDRSKPVRYSRVAANLYQMPSGRAEIAVCMQDDSDTFYGATYGTQYTSDSDLCLTFCCAEPKFTIARSQRSARDGSILNWNERLWVIDGQLYRIATYLSYRNGVYEWVEPQPVEAIYYQTEDESVCLYRSGDQIPVVTVEEYRQYRAAANLSTKKLPEEYTQPVNYFARRAMAFVRGEEMPDVPVINQAGDATLPEPPGSTLSEPLGSTLSEPTGSTPSEPQQSAVSVPAASQ